MIQSLESLQTVTLNHLTLDPHVQMRAALSDDAIEQYRELYEDGGPTALPPLRGFQDALTVWVADGFQRYHAAEKAGLKELPVIVTPGTRRDAIIYAAGANAEHGVRRTRRDIRRAIKQLLADKEWRMWTNSEIARAVKCDPRTVDSVRADLPKSYSPRRRAYKNRKGQVRYYTINETPEPDETPPPPPKAPQFRTVECPHCHRLIQIPERRNA